MPVASELQAQERNDSVTRLYHLSLKYIIAFCVPLFVCVGVFAHPLVALWLGEGNDLIATTLQILIIPNFINLMTGPAYFISLGIGKAKYGMYSNVVGLFINVVLSSVLLRFYGYFGAVAGTIVALTLEAIFFLTLFHRSLAVRWSKSLLLFIRPLVGISLGVTLALAVGYFIELLAVKTFIMVGLTIAIYLFVLFRAAYFDDEDKRYLREIKRSVVEMFPTLPERV
jgi:O-antigen/teichoic acid export membrane protein